VYFNEALFAAIKRFFKGKLQNENDENGNNLDHIAKVEADTKLEIEKKKKKQLKNGEFVIDEESFINPLVDLLYRKLVFSCWLNFSKN
jgi:hypothetical protein